MLLLVVVTRDFSRNDIKRPKRATNLRCNDGKFLISWREARSLKIKGRRRQSVRRTWIVERQTAALTSPYVNSITEKTFQKISRSNSIQFDRLISFYDFDG